MLVSVVPWFGPAHFGPVNFANVFLVPLAARMEVRWKQALRELRPEAEWQPLPVQRLRMVLAATMFARTAESQPSAE